MNEQYINTLLNITAEINEACKLLNRITMQAEVMITDLQLGDDAEGTNEYYEGGNG